MSLYVGKTVRLINKSTNEEYVYEVVQIIYSDGVSGVACITENGIEDFYFSDYIMKPMSWRKGLDK